MNIYTIAIDALEDSAEFRVKIMTESGKLDETVVPDHFGFRGDISSDAMMDSPDPSVVKIMSDSGKLDDVVVPNYFGIPKDVGNIVAIHAAAAPTKKEDDNEVGKKRSKISSINKENNLNVPSAVA
eukprot:scaffold13809_cov69-Skeletonema_menzelii.AAC.2